MTRHDRSPARRAARLAMAPTLAVAVSVAVAVAVSAQGLLAVAAEPPRPARSEDDESTGTRADRLLADFESDDWGAWKADGDAFEGGPARGAQPNQMPVMGYRGERLVNSFRGGDGTTGTLTSPEFVLDRPWLTFLIGGGRHAGETCVELVVKGETVRTVTGINSEYLEPRAWDVEEYAGAAARIVIVDRAKGGWGHVNADHFVLTDAAPELRSDKDARLRFAADAVEKAAREIDESTRPSFHFTPLAQWMNDPNGTIYHDGWYHVFFQHNPYDDRWGNMHWGHTRSRDLVHWERLPIALWPSKTAGEDHVFSGCAWRDDDGDVVLLYTSVGEGRPNEQWAALPASSDLLEWQKPEANPLLTSEAPDGTRFGGGIRDPFVFKADGRTFLVVGADTKDEAVVPIWEASDGSLLEWSYRGIAWSAPKSEMEFPECPNFFPLDGKFVLLTSPYRPVEYRVGSFDTDALRFTPETSGRIDASDQYYATNIATAPDGRTILFGWIRGFEDGLGWNGCLALPRVIEIAADGTPRQAPVPALEELRGEARSREKVRVAAGAVELATVGDAFELRISLAPGSAKRSGIRVVGAEDRAFEVAFDGERVALAGRSTELSAAAMGERLDLRVFVDGPVVEVFVEGRTTITRVVPDPGDRLRVEAFAEGGEAEVVEATVWELDGIW